MNKRSPEEDRLLNDLHAQLLLERIFTRGYVPPQELYDRYVQYLIRKPYNEKAHYPLTESEVTRINKCKRGKSTTSQPTTRAAPFTTQPPQEFPLKSSLNLIPMHNYSFIQHQPIPTISLNK
jgi:hypothetical protein